MRRISVAFTLLLLVALPLYAQPDSSFAESPASLQEIRQDIAVGNARWIKAFRQGDPDQAAALFDKDGALLGEGGEITYGRDEIRRAMRRWMKQLGHAVVTLDTRDLWRIGGFVYETGHYEYTWYPSGADSSSTSSGTYLAIWKLQVDESWKIYRSLPLPR